ncbi:hypothetical protein Pflav_086770 [Phytohabitans flavus]|uniref:HTH tetR-type domain-containing protein n=1 Tax=Phytohabitans flavus TaxID=1076124 RepID=A0A6F8Y875_9ACTN|nr:helix-turn-helix domain-containing protein [Phytohabitans flavus]BCB82267.1 hypothetical protein Pflav_086770 [Phytohabitans flavus]
MRADARRNYERLLAEADAVFREHGTEASLEEIARRAGVAIGTLYAHFPTRHALLESLMRDRNDAVVAQGRSCWVVSRPARRWRPGRGSRPRTPPPTGGWPPR